MIILQKPLLCNRKEEVKMPREKELFRDNLARIDAAFPEKEILFITDLKKYFGVKDPRTVRRLLKMPRNEKSLTKCQLASRLS